ncbi:GNAT family N-acetyltransferase [Kiritimatiella glycovorans]|uniref:BioF2-like acetyltransferase domain-containing protein n=1 Tax=Kiritimatiella glycovorans TaxID=1307763 RepID=A0A0G3EEL8_9BACT|nr:GNAT family N-acetyltransferase [Kiritimatiella glycovorans]AKJ64911.1 hypothetical protein L21SP4_01669 [Kiritimatiella glycovorans]
MGSNGSGIAARVVEPHEDEAWDALVASSPTANRFLRSDCLRMLEETDSLGIRFRRVGVFDDAGALRGGWALPTMQRMGIRASTYFEFFYAGPMLAPDLETGSVHVCRERLDVLHALAQAQTRELHLIEAEGHPRFVDARGLWYAGFELQTLYTHIWHFGNPDDVFMKMNRERRRLIRRADESLRFGLLTSDDVAEGFVPLYKRLMQKFDWLPGEQWSRDLQDRLQWLWDHDVGAVYGAWDENGALCGAVIVLVSEEDRTIYLWRCGYDTSRKGNTIVPALYWHAAQHWLQQWGEPLACNLGGSPLISLAQFKDYLGADVVPHLRLVYRPLRPRPVLWRLGRGIKETSRRRLTRTRVSLLNEE